MKIIKNNFKKMNNNRNLKYKKIEKIKINKQKKPRQAA